MSVDPKSTYYDHGGIETVEILRAKLTSEQMVGYLLGNVLKYASRLNWKGCSERDAEKLSLYAMWLHEELAPPPDERQEQVRERHDIKPDPAGQLGDYGACGVDAERPADGRPSKHNCPSGANCREDCGLEPCKRESSA